MTPAELRRAAEDRRRGPRRVEEIALHYTKEALVAAALEVADEFDPLDETLLALHKAAEAYRKAAGL